MEAYEVGSKCHALWINKPLGVHVVGISCFCFIKSFKLVKQIYYFLLTMYIFFYIDRVKTSWMG